jgi:hypothetical protein
MTFHLSCGVNEGVHIGAGAMKHVGIKQARQELPGLIDRAEAGEAAKAWAK